MADWKTIKAEYIAGGTSYRELAKKYSVSFGTLRNVAAREKWTELRDRAMTKADTELTNRTGKRNGQRTSKILDIADKLLDKLNDTLELMDVLNSRSLKEFTSALKDLKEIKGFKSDIDIREQEARIAKLQKEAQEEQEDKSIVVQISDDLEEYSG